MNKQELLARQQTIIQRITEGDAPANKTFYGDNQSVLYLHAFSDSVEAMFDFGIFNHQTAKIIMDKLHRFYDNVTPEEIDLLNMVTVPCAHCGTDLTLDEFHRVTSHPGRIGIDVTTANGKLYTEVCV